MLFALLMIRVHAGCTPKQLLLFFVFFATPEIDRTNLREGSQGALRGSQRLSEALRCSQRLSETFRGSQGLSEALRSSQRLPDALRCSQKLSDALRSPNELMCARTCGGII